jgi:hypothetical protein
MSERELLGKIEEDLRLAAEGRRRVLYLEGRTDVRILLGLLGRVEATVMPDSVLHDGILIRGLTDRSKFGAGSKAVRQRVELAARHGYPGVFGVLDGDGEQCSALAPEFDAPYAGPLFRWKAYCIENLLARAPWPADWGIAPDWHTVLADLAPYVALNRLGLTLRARLQRLGLDRFINPGSASPLLTTDELRGKLRDGQHELAGLDVVAMYDAELTKFASTLERGVDEAHTLVNGKWLIDLCVPVPAGRTQEERRDAWADHVARLGGDPEIKAWWARTLAA